MGPIVKEVAASMEGKSVKFVTFDFTSAETKAAASAAAKAMGVEGTFGKNKGDTGFALLYDTKSQKVIKKMSSRDDVAQWKAEIEKGLGEA